MFSSNSLSYIVFVTLSIPLAFPVSCFVCTSFNVVLLIKFINVCSFRSGYASTSCTILSIPVNITLFRLQCVASGATVMFLCSVRFVRQSPSLHVFIDTLPWYYGPLRLPVCLRTSSDFIPCYVLPALSWGHTGSPGYP